MRKRKSNIALLLLAATLVAAIVLHQRITQQAQQAHDATLANIETPKQVRFYQDLTATTPTAPNDDTPSTPPTTTQTSDDPCGSPQAIMAQWAELFEEAPKWADDDLFFSTFRVFEPDEEPPLTTIYDKARKMERFLDRVRTLAPCGGPLYPLTFPEVYQEYPPHWYGGLDRIETLLSFDAYVAAKQDDFARVVTNLIAAMQMADALAREPLLQAQAVRYDFYHQTGHTYTHIYDNVPLPQEYLAQLSEHLAQAHHREGLYVGLAGEPNKAVHTFDNFRNESYLERIKVMNFITATRRVIWRTPVCKPFVLEDERTAVDILNRIATLPNAPFFEISSQLDRFRTEVEALPITRDFSKGIIPWLLDGPFQRQAHHEINVDLWRLRLLAQRYRAETDALPQSLEEAATHFSETLPIDPSNGQPYSYKPEADCYVLTSTGIESIDGAPYPLGEYAWLCPR